MPPKKQVEPVSEVAPNGAKPSQQTKREPLQAKKQDEVQEEKIMELKEGEVLDIAKLKEMNIATLVAVAKDLGVTFIACTTTMGLMGIPKDTLVDGVDQLAGVSTYLAEAKDAQVNLFI